MLRVMAASYCQRCKSMRELTSFRIGQDEKWRLRVFHWCRDCWREHSRAARKPRQRTAEQKREYNAYMREYVMRRHAAKARQTPKWADVKAIRAFYAACPEGHHVDHVVPLKGQKVRGLHVLANLQYLPASENIAKGNSFRQDLDATHEQRRADLVGKCRQTVRLHLDKA